MAVQNTLERFKSGTEQRFSGYTTRQKRIIVKVTSLVLVAVLWELAGQALGEVLFAPLSAVIPAYIDLALNGPMIPELLSSLQEMFIGYGSSASRRYAATAAVALLPLQVLLGGATVTIEGAIPWGYTPSVHALHLGAALAIFSALLLATLWSVEGQLPPGRTTGALGAAMAALVAGLPVARGVGLQYTTAAQTVYYALCLTCFAALLTGAVWAREERAGPYVDVLAAAALPTVVFQLVVAREILGFYGVVPVAYLGSILGTAGLVAVALWQVRGDDAGDSAAASHVRGD